MRKINEIIIHCSDTEQNVDFKAKNIDSWHRKRGFSCIGYHYVVDIDGSVERGRTLDQVGAHCKNHNAHSIGICYVGGKRFGKHYNTITAMQIDTLCNLLVDLCNAFDLGYHSIKLHYEYNKYKSCPCFNRKWFDSVFRIRIESQLSNYKLL